ncbi:GNAT family N-acetyltransferase [Sporobolomyces koalae]|uniref:GNAT family N-acetyltransferase n=1 Tax=Sporobolomyces koalae TaxID=500713 RepID=UPI0031740267
MLLNEATTVYNSRLVLRPYRRWHVPQYHAWMEDPKIRELTASERLSAEEEEDMQRSWRLDQDKLTFIVHARLPTAPCPTVDRDGFLQAHNDSSTMIGDVNLFLHTLDDDEDDQEEEQQSASKTPRPARQAAELEIMLPPNESSLYKPRSGLALSTLQLFLTYAKDQLGFEPSQFMAKVSYDNEPSLKLFEKLGFVERKRVEVFREIELGWTGASSWPWESESGWQFATLEDPRDPERD